MNEPKLEGFWYSSREPHFPMPIPSVLSDDEAKKIHDLIKQKERTAYLCLYRGMSPSRLEKSHVGNGTYETPEWHWPEGFAEHYVLKHKVKPTDEFLKFIGYNDEQAQTDSTNDM
jgi:hypothetical protein